MPHSVRHPVYCICLCDPYCRQDGLRTAAVSYFILFITILLYYMHGKNYRASGTNVSRDMCVYKAVHEEICQWQVGNMSLKKGSESHGAIINGYGST